MWGAGIGMEHVGSGPNLPGGFEPFRTFEIGDMKYGATEDESTVWRENSQTGVTETSPQVREEYLSYVTKESMVWGFFKSHFYDFLHVISQKECDLTGRGQSGGNADYHDVFEDISDWQAESSSQPYKQFRVMIDNNEIIVADKDNDRRFDHISLNEFYEAGPYRPVVLDGNGFDPLISSILKYSSQTSQACRPNRDDIVDGIAIGALGIGAIVFLAVAFV